MTDSEIELRFKKLFESNYADLLGLAIKIIHDEDKSKDLVQEIFLHLWEKREQIQIHTSAIVYLKTSVYNPCISHLRRQSKMKLVDGDMSICSRDRLPFGRSVIS